MAKAGKVGERADYSDRERMIADLCSILRTIAHDYHATLVPFDSLVAEAIASTLSLPVTYWVWDGIHPTPALHYRMAQMWMESTGL